MLVAGLVVLAVGCALTPFVDDGFGLAVSLGLLASMGSGIGSFSVLIGAAAQRLPADARRPLDAYAAGVRAFVESGQQARAPEFVLLDARGEALVGDLKTVPGGRAVLSAPASDTASGAASVWAKTGVEKQATAAAPASNVVLIVMANPLVLALRPVREH